MALFQPPSGRRLCAIAATFATVAAILLVTMPAFATPREPGDPVPDPSASPTPQPAPAAVRVTAPDLTIGSSYWQGATEQYDVRATVTNAGEPALTTVTEFSLPAGLTRVAASAGGCAATGSSFSCPLARGASVTILVTVTVSADAWREPRSGLVRTTATAVEGGSAASAEDPFAVVFPPGPPTPGIDLATSDAILPPRQTGRSDTALLEVRLRNTGSVPALGAVEIVTPPGVQVATVPTQCINRERLNPTQERCTLGRVTAGQQIVLTFGLSVRPQARAEAPLRGSVLGSLLPTGQDLVTVQTTYEVVVAVSPAATPEPTGSPELGAPVAPAGGGVGGNRPDHPVAQSVSRPMSVIPVVTALVGLFTVLGTMVILSLRRRMRDEPIPPGVRA